MKDEFLFISSITPKKTNQPNLLVGIGDDAAIYRSGVNMEQVVCVDTMVEGVHFRHDTMDSYDVGYKALAVNISDLAAMGATPKYYLVSIAIPPNWKQEELEVIYQGMTDLAENFEMDLIGGDTVSTKGPLVLTVTVIGEVERDRHLLRSLAKPGDIVFVTGTVGDSAAGLELLFQAGKERAFSEQEQYLVKAHQQPEPQVVAGRILASSGGRVALNDVSDGIASEANELAEASQVEILLEEKLLPRSEALSQYSKELQLKYMLFGGEDFQLIGTMNPNDWEKVKQSFCEHNIVITKIGTVKKAKEPKVVLIDENQNELILEKKGFNHFNREN